MASRLIELVTDEEIIKKLREKLPYLFALAELEASRAGKVGMQVGSVRENILIALLIYKFGEQGVNTDIAITQPEVDAELFGYPISVKTITGDGGVKVVWTVDSNSARRFIDNYSPKADILLAQIRWGGIGGVYYFPLEAQEKAFRELGRERYFKLPKLGTNPRGVEFSREALSNLKSDSSTCVVEIDWGPRKQLSSGEIYRRWLDYWRE